MNTDTSKIDRVLKKLRKKNPLLFKTTTKKIIQLSELNPIGIKHIKNLKGNLNHLKRVHIGIHVLTFQVKGNTIIFEKFIHHDDAYRR